MPEENQLQSICVFVSFIFTKIMLESSQETKKKWQSKNLVSTHLKLLDKLFGIRGRDKDVTLRWFDKAIINGFINESEEVIVITIHI